MKFIATKAVKRISFLAVFLIVSYILFSSFCCLIEVPPYVASKTPRSDFIPNKYGKGELIIDPIYQKIPIMILRGSPAELGEQQGRLLKPQLTTSIDTYLNRFLAQEEPKKRALVGMKSMEPFVPVEYRQELEAMSHASGLSFDRLLLLQTIIDEPRLPFCSAIISSRPATKEAPLIFGRNLDFPSLGIAVHHSLITVYQPDGKKSFASITWPGFAGVISGINEDGLTLAMLVSFDGTTNLAGMPSIMLFRKILEETSDLDGAVKIIKETKRTAPTNLAIADARGQSAVIEFTSDNVAVRYPEKGLLYCTNWFISEQMKLSEGDKRYAAMQKQAEGYYGKIGLAETIKVLKSAILPVINIQSMVILPREKIIHLSIGFIPAAERDFRKIDLTEYLNPHK